MSDSETQESILKNLNKTRQMWNSKIDLGTPTYLIPKSPHSPLFPQQQSTINGNSTTFVEVVRAYEQISEDFELPDIKSMRSQWEVSHKKSYIPLPNAKSPAALDREKSFKQENNQQLEPVNHSEKVDDEVYEVKLTKLKAQFESAAKAANKPRPKSPKTPMHDSSLKEQISRNPSTNQDFNASSYKILRFEDEVTSPNEQFATEQRAETDGLIVNLSSIKLQFEKRKDENLISPQLTLKRIQDKTVYNKISPLTHNSLILSKEDSSSQGDFRVSIRDEPIKSSEPVYDEMIGEESVKDRLKKYKAIAEVVGIQEPSSTKKTFKKRETGLSTKGSTNTEKEVKSLDSYKLDIVRPSPAGTRETPDYVGSVDLNHTKAVFEAENLKQSKRSLSKRGSNFGISTGSASDRSGRSSVSSSSEASRSSSRHSVASSRSPSNKRSKSSPPIDDGTLGQNNMNEIVKPPPAGTKEKPDFVSAVKVSSMKIMFETSKSQSSNSSPTPRAQVIKVVTSKTSVNQNINPVDVVRPSTAGSKEIPDYNLSADFLKSRTALFNSPQPKEYTPRNKINPISKTPPKEIVNAQQQEESSLDYQLSQSLQETKKMFEKSNPVSSPKPSTEKSMTPKPPAIDVVRPPPAGTREVDIIPASNIRSAKNLFENKQNDAIQASTPKTVIDIHSEAEEDQKREREIAAKNVTTTTTTVIQTINAECEIKDAVAVPEDSKVKQVEEVEYVIEDETLEKAMQQNSELSLDAQKSELVLGSNQIIVPTNEPKIECEKSLRHDKDYHELVKENDAQSESESENEGEYVIQKKDESEQIAEENEFGYTAASIRVSLSESNNVETNSHTQVTNENEKFEEIPAQQDMINAVGDNTDVKTGTFFSGQLVATGSTAVNNVSHETENDDNDATSATTSGILLDMSDIDTGNLVARGNLLDSFQNDHTVTHESIKAFSNPDHVAVFDPLISPNNSEQTLPNETNPNTVDLLNGFSDFTLTENNPSPTVTHFDSKQPDLNPFGMINPSGQFEHDPFDLFSSTLAPSITQDTYQKNPFDLFQ